jgi:hypothetical protein
MAESCTVDAELFGSLQEAIDFLAERGGGGVYTELADTLFAKSLKLPDTVKLRARRPAAA